jgi:hypothetical protein
MATFSSFFSQDMAILFYFKSQKTLCRIRQGFFFLASVRNFAKKENTDHIVQQYEIIRYYYSTI